MRQGDARALALSRGGGVGDPRLRGLRSAASRRVRVTRGRRQDRHGHREHGPAFAAWATTSASTPRLLDEFEEAYMGEWESGEDFAEEMLDDMGRIEKVMRAAAGDLAPYVTDRLRGLLRRPRRERRDQRYSGEAQWRHLRLPELVRILVVELSTNDASAHRMW